MALTVGGLEQLALDDLLDLVGLEEHARREVVTLAVGGQPKRLDRVDLVTRFPMSIRSFTSVLTHQDRAS